MHNIYIHSKPPCILISFLHWAQQHKVCGLVIGELYPHQFLILSCQIIPQTSVLVDSSGACWAAINTQRFE